jgi:hypothetical protein
MVARRKVLFFGYGRTLRLPRPARAAAPFAGLAVAAALLAALPDVPRTEALVAAAILVAAAAARALQKRLALAQLREAADRVLLRGASFPMTPLLTWRASELMSVGRREALAAAIARMERSASKALLPGAAPLNRRAVRLNRARLDAIVDRLLGDDLVSPRGMVLLERLLDEPRSPLFDTEQRNDVAVELDRVLRALDEPVWGSRR